MTPLTQVDPPPSTDDQRGRVLAAASVAFAARGYHDTSLEEISSESGVDSRALSEMFPDRYDILRDVSRGAVRVFMQCADAPVGVDARQARTALNGIITSLTRASIEHRAAGAVCRTEYRYLRPDDAELLLADLNELRARVQRPLMVARPELSDVDADILATAALSTISSITIHTTPLAEPKIETLLTLSAMRLLDSEPATIADARPQIPAASPPWRTDTSERGTILAAFRGVGSPGG